MHSLDSKSQRRADASRKEVLVAQVVCNVSPNKRKKKKNTKKVPHKTQEKIFFPRIQVSESFLERETKREAPATGKKGAEILKVGGFLLSVFLYFVLMV